MNQEVTAVCQRIKALLAECVAGRPARIDNVTVANSLACLPENHPVARALAMFFGVVIAHTSALGGGRLASAVQITTAKHKLHQVMEAWPDKKAFDELHELCGLADTNLQNWTTDAMANMEGVS